MATSLEKPAIVYQAVNLINGHRYIGATSQTLGTRKSKHRHEARKSGSSCRHFHSAIRHYGWNSFHFTVIAHFDNSKDAFLAEVRPIADFKPEYNITRGGEGTPGHVVSKETRAKISASRKGARAPNKGVPHTAATRAKIAARAIGRVHSLEWRAQRSMMQRNNSATRKPVICLTDRREFVSAIAASYYYGLRPYAVSNAISKTKGKWLGLKFAFIGGGR